MTKKDLEDLAKKNEKEIKIYKSLGQNHSADFSYGYAAALYYVIKHIDELCEGVRQDKLMQRATEEAKYYIREYFQDKYGYDDKWSKDEIEDRIQRALDEGDAETLANSFIDSADDGIPNDEWCETIVRDFYD